MDVKPIDVGDMVMVNKVVYTKRHGEFHSPMLECIGHNHLVSSVHGDFVELDGCSVWSWHYKDLIQLTPETKQQVCLREFSKLAFKLIEDRVIQLPDGDGLLAWYNKYTDKFDLDGVYQCYEMFKLTFKL